MSPEVFSVHPGQVDSSLGTMAPEFKLRSISETKASNEANCSALR